NRRQGTARLMITWMLVHYFGGIALIFCEVFLPGGVLGVLGVCAIFASAALGVYAYPDMWYAIVGTQFVGVVITGAFLLWWFPRSSMSRQLVLSAGLDKSDGYESDANNTEL